MTPVGAVVLSCEHAASRVPREWAEAFAGSARTLASHRGYDRGALELARFLRRALRSAQAGSVPLVAARVSRLLVDTNRSLDHPGLFSSYTRGAGERERARLIERHWRPHRAALIARIEEALAAHSDAAVLHLGVHSFTPVLRGQRREVDVGLLFDPARALERAFCHIWRRELELLSDVVVRDNQPYHGTEDGLTTSLRLQYPAARYLGLELEVNQRFVRRGGVAWRALQEGLARSLVAALRASGARPA